MSIDTTCIKRLKQSLDAGAPLPEVLTIALGNTEAAGGLWRFFFERLARRGCRALELGQ